MFVDVDLNKRVNKQSRCRWFEMPWHSLWRHWNEFLCQYIYELSQVYTGVKNRFIFVKKSVHHKIFKKALIFKKQWLARRNVMKYTDLNIDSLVEDYSNCIANALELLQLRHRFTSYCYPLRYMFVVVTILVSLPEASFGFRVLSLPAPVCPSVRLCLSKSLVCARDNSRRSQLSARLLILAAEGIMAFNVVLVLYCGVSQQWR